MRRWSTRSYLRSESLDRIFEIGRGTLSFVGLLTMLFLALQLIDRGIEIGAAARPNSTLTLAEQPPLAEMRPASGRRELAPKEAATAQFLARNYRIAEEVAQDLVVAAFDVGSIVGLEPGLLLAVMAIESRFNPIAQSDMGAKGLMQVIPKYHEDKINGHGGAEAILDPWVNIMVGAQILREYVSRTGSLEAGLQWYNGAANDRSRQYAERILSEKAQFDRVLTKRRNGGASTRI
jgi:soluble lytic murein transglycosylase-like protein